MGFQFLNGLTSQEGYYFVTEIINILLGDDKDLEKLIAVAGIKDNTHYKKIFQIFLKNMKEDEYPLSSYTPKRLSIAI